MVSLKTRTVEHLLFKYDLRLQDVAKAWAVDYQDELLPWWREDSDQRPTALQQASPQEIISRTLLWKAGSLRGRADYCEKLAAVAREDVSSPED